MSSLGSRGKPLASERKALNLEGSKGVISKIGICKISTAESFKQYRGFGISVRKIWYKLSEGFGRLEIMSPALNAEIK